MDFNRMFQDWKDVEEYRARSVIYSERDPADALYVVLAGRVELKRRGHSLGVAEEGGVFGEMAVLEGATRNATAVARTKVRVARLDREQMEDMMRRDTAFSMHVMAELASRLRSVDELISTQLIQTS